MKTLPPTVSALRNRSIAICLAVFAISAVVSGVSTQLAGHVRATVAIHQSSTSTSQAHTTRAFETSAIASPMETNFWLTTAAGQVYPFGSAQSYGSVTGHLAAPIVAMAPTSDNGGYWLVASDGGVFSFGDARFYGSTGNIHLNKPIVGITPTPDDGGYWLVASDGGIFSFGDAQFYGSTGNIHLNEPVVGMASTHDGQGYWLVASDGGIFSFGDAQFYGSTGNIRLAKPVIGMAKTHDGDGYWLIAKDGGVFSFGDAQFYGSTGADPGEPAEKIVSSPSSNGYWVVDQNGTAYPFGAVSGPPPTVGLLFTEQTPGDAAVLFAFQQLGKPYIWGGNGPVGYDCSGLALASWEHGANVGFARVSDDQYQTAGSPVGLTSLQAGDLVFWGISQTDPSSVYHTAIYIGGGQIIEASGPDIHFSALGQWGTSDLMPHGMRP